MIVILSSIMGFLINLTFRSLLSFSHWNTEKKAWR